MNITQPHYNTVQVHKVNANPHLGSFLLKLRIEKVCTLINPASLVAFQSYTLPSEGKANDKDVTSIKRTSSSKRTVLNLPKSHPNSALETQIHPSDYAILISASLRKKVVSIGGMTLDYHLSLQRSSGRN